MTLDIRHEIPLAPYTTFKIGGPAQFLVEVKSEDDVVAALQKARQEKWPVTLLGGGSNVLIADEGVKGLVIINRLEGWQINSPVSVPEKKKEKIHSRLGQIETKVKFEDICYDELDKPRVEVEAWSGTVLSKMIDGLLEQGVTGLQWFYGIPGSVGGAVYNNIHCGSFFLGEYISAVEVIATDLRKKARSIKECGFGYDSSSFQKNGDFILKVKFNLFAGDVERAREFIRIWNAYRLSRYELPSAGCVFKNLDPDTQERLNLPTPSWGYIIDKVLGLKGHRIGGAKISEKHAAFIVNETGEAKVTDVLALIEKVKTESQKKLGLTPELEIFCLGEFAKKVNIDKEEKGN